jgi:REP element-mobilizing transposase RayT
MSAEPIVIRRRSIRLKDYDYSSPGAYFVTIVTHGYQCIFGMIVENQMHLNNLGQIVQKCWVELPDHFSDTEVNPFVVMPNHIHGIITIYENERVIRRHSLVGARYIVPLQQMIILPQGMIVPKKQKNSVSRSLAQSQR